MDKITIRIKAQVYENIEWGILIQVTSKNSDILQTEEIWSDHLKDKYMGMEVVSSTYGNTLFTKSTHKKL